MSLKDKYSSLYRDIRDALRKPVVSVLPGHLSFFLLLSSIPLILIFGILANTFSISYDFVVEFLTLSLPASTSKLILPLFSTPAPDISISILLISALYLASRATKAIILTANNIYKVNRNNIQDFIKAIIITILLILLISFMIVILILGEKILELLDMLPEIGFITKKLLGSINILRWPAAILVIFLSVKFIYTISPNKKINSKSVNKGTLFTTISWAIITFIYSFYVMNYASYNTYYGSASNIIVLMLWIYLISKIFVIGMIINSIEDKKNSN